MRGLHNGIRLGKAAAPKRGPGLSNAKDRAVYDLCHQAWRAGLIRSWYFGRRSETDPRIVWRLDGDEMPGTETTRVMSIVKDRMDAEGIAAFGWGDLWCGYRPLVVTYTDGSVLVQQYDAATNAIDVREVAA